jgi:hypothetical protein
MCDGVNDLRSQNPTRYKWIVNDLSPQGSGNTLSAPTPPVTNSGRIYGVGRGNPGWLQKYRCLSNSVIVAGWYYPAVDLVLDKLCYIDQDANPMVYVNLMALLSAQYPSTIFVYATIPLTTAEDSDNRKRNNYNNAVRAWSATNDAVLFDIADIEAHDTNNILQFFIYNGVTNQKMWAPYSNDGGHLNTLGRQRVAKGWYAVGAAVAIPESGTWFGLALLLHAVWQRRSYRRDGI